MERFDIIIRHQKTTETTAAICWAQAHELTDTGLHCVSGGADFTIMPVPGIGVIKPDPICIYPFPDVPPPSDIRGPFVGLCPLRPDQQHSGQDVFTRLS